MNYESQGEWAIQGEWLFGPDPFKWRFRCPSCGNVQTPEDFLRFKPMGATPDTAYQDCIGRWDRMRGCDWAAYGLFRGPDFVARAGGGEVAVFPFAPLEPEIQRPSEPKPEARV